MQNEPSTPDKDAFTKRLKLAIKLGGGAKAVAGRSGIPVKTLYNYMEEISEPKFITVVRIARAVDVSLDWLAAGEPPVHTAKRIGQFIEATGRSTSVPVLGLAECGLKGWYQGAPMAVSAARPGDLQDPDAFAIIAIGTSMRPAGICQGFLCFCSPRMAVDKGDRVYIELRDGTATIKKYLCRDETWLYFQGWLDPDEAGRQEPYSDQVKLDQVARLATIVYVKVKL